MSVLSATVGRPVHVESDMNSSPTFNICHLYVSTMACTDYSHFGGWKNEKINISNTDLTSKSGSFTRLYGGTLRYDTMYIIIQHRLI